MATNVTNYQCPACTGPLHFSSDSGQLECEYCGTSYDVETIESIYPDKDTPPPPASDPEWDLHMEEWTGEDTANMRAYNCPSCGAEVVTDAVTAATSCPYCSNPSIVPGQLTGMLKPDYVIPFKFNKEAAKEALKKHYKGKKFLPKTFSSENKLQELKGIYVPFWLFSAKSDGEARYSGIKEHSYTSGDEEVTVTEYYHVVREGDISFDKVPVDGSTKMPDAHMDAIEPYDYADLAPFSVAYLPGFLADKYDVDADTCIKRANERIRTSTEDAFESTIKGYNSVLLESSNINIEPGEAKYALMPVWLLNTKWKGQDFLFAMNGQTGKLIGDLPIDKGRVAKWFAGISIPLMVLMGLLSYLF